MTNTWLHKRPDRLLGYVYDGFLKYRNYTQFIDSILSIKSVVMFANSGKYSPLPHMQLEIYSSVCGSVPRVWLDFDCIFVVLTRGNVTLNIAVDPYVRMTLRSQPSCEENWPV